jgi:hypothetical protein
MTTKVTTAVLANTAVTAGTYGGTTQHSVVTVDAQGRITYAANATPSIATTQLTGTITNSQLAGSITSDKITSVSNTAISGTITSSQIQSITSSQVTTALGYTPYNNTNPSGYLTSSTGVTTVNVNGSTSSGAITVRGLGLGGETWHDVSGSRSSGTQYTNSRSYPIAFSAYGSGSGASSTQIYINGSLVYSNNAQWNGAGAIPGGWFIVPPGATYQINLSTGVSGWWELY